MAKKNAAAAEAPAASQQQQLAPASAEKQALAKTKSVRDLIQASSKQFAEVLPKHMKVDRLVKVACAAVSRTPQLAECTSTSLLLSLMQCAELGLEPGSALGECYLVPFYNSKAQVRECQMIVGYRGLIALARRSGAILDIEAHVVREGDEFDYEKGLAPRLFHKPYAGDNRQALVVAAYAIAVLVNGHKKFEVMERWEVDAIRARSQAADFGPWKNDFAEMAKKTVVRRMAKYLPMSVELANALEVDADRAVDVDAREVASGLMSPAPAAPQLPAAGKSGFRDRVAAAAAAEPAAEPPPPHDDNDLSPELGGKGTPSSPPATAAAEKPAAQAAPPASPEKPAKPPKSDTSPAERQPGEDDDK